MAKRDPTEATPIKVSVPIDQTGLPGGYGCITKRPALRQKFVKFADFAAAVEKDRPKMTKAASEPIFATVKIFWTVLPRRSPLVLIQVSKIIDKMPSRFWRFRPTLYGPSKPNHKCHGPNVPSFQIQSVAVNHGIITAVNLAKAMATAAIVEVWITRSMLQPYKNPHIEPSDSRR